MKISQKKTIVHTICACILRFSMSFANFAVHFSMALYAKNPLTKKNSGMRNEMSAVFSTVSYPLMSNEKMDTCWSTTRIMVNPRRVSKNFILPPPISVSYCYSCVCCRYFLGAKLVINIWICNPGFCHCCCWRNGSLYVPVS